MREYRRSVMIQEYRIVNGYVGVRFGVALHANFPHNERHRSSDLRRHNEAGAFMVCASIWPGNDQFIHLARW